ncbi:MAG: ATP-binding protein, partial [Nitrospirota bacterium]|nr:ATP-binding protein [Nitrospirota bacterium]
LLRSAAIYGANAAGKSNVIKALAVMQKIVTGSSSKGQVDEDLPLVPFLLDETSSKAPSEFEIEFVSEGVRYQYGFSTTKKRILEEWFIAYPRGVAQRWIDRTYDEEQQKYHWGGMSKLAGRKQVWRDATRPNALFFSTAVQLNSEQLLPAHRWFHNVLRVAGFGGWSKKFTIRQCKEDSKKDEILDLLKTADVGIDNLKFEEEKFSLDSLPKKMPDELKEELSSKLEGETLIEVKTVHQNNHGKNVIFEMDDESDGTQKVFALAGPWLATLEKGYVLVMDELHDNLHPHIVKYLVNLFHSAETNPKNAQLLFTTHDTSILDQEVLRRDQIWFCQKNKKNSTELYPLTDFSPRKGVENLEKGYLSGRYGALPYIRKRKVEAAC